MLDILAITGPIFLIIALGFAAVRTGLFGRADMRVLGSFVINIALPAVLFKALSDRSFDEVMDARYLAAYVAGSLLCFGIGLAVALRVRRYDLRKSALIGMGMSMSNSAFIGFPLAFQLFGPIAAIPLALSVLVENLIMLPIVLTLADRSGQGRTRLAPLVAQTFARLLRNPVVIAIVAGFACSVLGLRLPGTAARAVEMLAMASAPVALFVIGGSLLGQQVRSMAGDIAMVAAGKLLLHPLAVLVALQFVPGMDPTLRLAAVMMASAPMLTVYPLFGQRYGHEGLCTTALVVTTVASFFSLTAMVAVVQAVQGG